MDQERVGSAFIPADQDGTTISAFAFDRRLRHCEHWRRRGHPFNEGCRNDLEGLFCRRASICSTLPRVPAIANFNFSHAEQPGRE